MTRVVEINTRGQMGGDACRFLGKAHIIPPVGGGPGGIPPWGGGAPYCCGGGGCWPYPPAPVGGGAPPVGGGIFPPGGGAPYCCCCCGGGGCWPFPCWLYPPGGGGCILLPNRPLVCLPLSSPSCPYPGSLRSSFSYALVPVLRDTLSRRTGLSAPVSLGWKRSPTLGLRLLSTAA